MDFCIRDHKLNKGENDFISLIKYIRIQNKSCMFPLHSTDYMSKKARTLQKQNLEDLQCAYPHIRMCLCSYLSILCTFFLLGSDCLLFLLGPNQCTPCAGSHLTYLPWWHHKWLKRAIMEWMLISRKYPQFAIPVLEDQSSMC